MTGRSFILGIQGTGRWKAAGHGYRGGSLLGAAPQSSLRDFDALGTSDPSTEVLGHGRTCLRHSCAPSLRHSCAPSLRHSCAPSLRHSCALVPTALMLPVATALMRPRPVRDARK